jgi:hypothetical protein
MVKADFIKTEDPEPIIIITANRMLPSHGLGGAGL